MINAQQLRENLADIHHRISVASVRAGRKPEEVLLVAVTKTHPIEVLEMAYDLGLRHFGENRVQELVRKEAALPKDINWHLIGNLQKNKAKQIAEFVHEVQSIHALDTAKELDRRATQASKTIRVLIEVNISGEASKDGIEPVETIGLLESIIASCPSLELCGLMGMASPEEVVERTRPQFKHLASILHEVQTLHPELQHFRDISMGMSNDFEIAIEEGATMVRIGNGLFGERSGFLGERG